MSARRNRRRRRLRTMERLEIRNLLFAPSDQTTLLGGLDSLESTFDQVENYAQYAQQLPGLEATAGQVLALSQSIRDGLIEPLSNVLDEIHEVDLDAITQSLDGHTVQVGEVTTAIEVGSVSAVEVETAARSAVEFTATLSSIKTSRQSLDDLADFSWIQWQANAPEVEVNAATEMTLTFGVDLLNNEFFSRLGEVTTEIQVSTNSVTTELIVGPIQGSVSNGDISVEARLTSDFGEAMLTENQLVGTASADLVNVTASGTLDASFEVEFSIGSYLGSETILWQDAAAFDGTLQLPTLTETGDLISAVRIDQADLVGFFSMIGTKLDEILSEDLPTFGEDFLPWVRGLKLPDLSNLSDELSDFVNQELTDDDGQASIRTFADLREKLEEWTGRNTVLSYLPNSSEVMFEFEVPATSVQSVNMGVEQDFSALADVEVTGAASVMSEFVLSGVFGVDLTELAEDTTPTDITDDDSWADHFFLDDLVVSADVEAATQSASASARLGFVGVGIGDVALDSSVSAMIRFADPEASDGRISFKRLSELIVSDPLRLVDSSSLSGDAEIVLSQMTASGIPGLELNNGEIKIGMDDLADPTTFTFQANNAIANLNALSTVTIDQWVELAGDVIALVDELAEGGMWNEPLPGIGQSVNDLLDHAATLQQAVDGLLDTDEMTIQRLGEQLEGLLENALQVQPEALDVVLSWQIDSLEMSVQYSLEKQANLPLSIDMAELIAASTGDHSAFDVLSDLIDVSGETELESRFALEGLLVFGVDVSSIIDGTTATPEFYVNEDTGLEVDFSVSAEDLNTALAIGPLGIFVREGHVTIDSDGDANTTPSARIAVGLSEVEDDRYTIGEIQSLQPADLDVTLGAGVSVVLPLYFPTVNDPVGGSVVDDANAIVIEIANLAGLFDNTDPGVVVRAPEVNSLVDDFDPLDDGLRILANGLDALLQYVESLLREQVLNQRLPLVGERLEKAADFLRDVREDALPVLRDQLQPQQLVDEVKQAIFHAIGDVLVLSDRNSDGVINYQDVELLVDANTQEAALDLSLGDTYQVDAGIDFDLGLPNIGLDLDGAVEATLDWRIDFGIGIDAENGFYLKTTDTNEIELDVEVTLPDAELTGTLGLFQVSVADQGSMLAGHFDIDLSEPSGDGKLTLDELLDGSVAARDLVSAKLSGSANVDFALIAGTTFATLPELHADFVLDWGFDGSDLQGSVERLAIENVELDLGSFISGFAGDILGRVQSVLEPIEPIVDVLTKPLPVANDLDFLVDTFAAETAPYDAVNLLDLASLLGNVDVEMLDAIVQIVGLVNSIPVPAAGESVMIPLGEVVIVGSGRDPDQVSRDDSQIATSDISDELSNYDGSDEQNRFAQESASFIEQMSSVKGGGIQFPFLDNPASLIGVLLGQDATLFGYQTPKLSAEFSMGITVPITGPLAVEFVGGIGVDAQFAFGYDTLGLRNFIESKDAKDLLDGFFVSDRENLDGTGSDIAELNLRGSLEAFASLTAGVASASIGGGIYATVGANLNDSNGDGKVRTQELIDNLPLCVFDFAGSLSAGLRMKAQVLGVPFSQNIATVKLLEFSTSCSAAQNLSLGEVDQDGVYTLFVGDLADRREVGQGITDEFVTFSPTSDADGKDAIEVSGFGITEIVRDVTKVVAHAGDGDDSLVIVGSLDVPVEFHGQSGNDELVGGMADDMLLGGGGDDLIQGGAGDDQIMGGSGLNTLEGGDGSDTISGGDRDDFVDGGDGNDLIQSGNGRDVVFGGDGSDTIHSGDGNDQVFGGDGLDLIYAGSGDDQVAGGLGDDSIHGEQGDDWIEGNAGNDFVHGGYGTDRIFGNQGADIVLGGYDSDWLVGGLGDDVLVGGNDIPVDGPDDSDDVISGGDGDDVMIGDDGAVIDFDGINYVIEVLSGNGDDLISGEAGDDWAHGVGGQDTMSGGVGNDHLIGGDDADLIFGDDGSDWLEGSDGEDEIYGHAGGDLIAGGRGNDRLDGGDDEDQVYAHETGGAEPWYVNPVETEDDGAEDVLLGRAGSDEIVGGAGDDFIDAGAGNDAVLDRGGNDIVDGGLGDDYLETTSGSDGIRGQWGDDEFVISADGFDRIDGQQGSKTNIGRQIPNSATNKLLVYADQLSLDFVAGSLATRMNDLDRIDAQYASQFSTRLDRQSIERITDDGNTLRLDIAEDASAILEGEWTEDGTELINGVNYRRLTNNGVTLVVRDLKPRQREEDVFDVNGDGAISAMDALLVINELALERHDVVLTPAAGANLLDVNGDNRISALDALYVINEINRRSTGIQAEADEEDQTVMDVESPAIGKLF